MRVLKLFPRNLSKISPDPFQLKGQKKSKEGKKRNPILTYNNGVLIHFAFAPTPVLVGISADLFLRLQGRVFRQRAIHATAFTSKEKPGLNCLGYIAFFFLFITPAPNIRPHLLS